jgi:hypothetical protein
LKRLVIYAGFHKAGTTAIQMALHQNRALLKESGITYPNGFGEWAHHVIGRPRATFPLAKAIEAIKKLTQKHDFVLLSSEFFSQYSEAALAQLSKALGTQVKIEAVFSMRRLEKVVGSQYQQLARIGIDLSFSEFASGLLEPENQVHETQVFWNRHDYDAIVNRWKNAFGAENIHVVFVDEANPEILPNWFETYLKLPAKSLKEIRDTRLNRSLDIEELALIQSLQRHLTPERRKTEWVPIFRDRLISNIVSTPTTNSESQKLQLSPELHQAFIQKATAQHEAIIASEVNTYGQWANPSAPRKASEEPTKIHIETVARAITSLDTELFLRRASLISIAKELVRRFAKAILRIFSKK